MYGNRAEKEKDPPDLQLRHFPAVGTCAAIEEPQICTAKTRVTCERSVSEEGLQDIYPQASLSSGRSYWI